MARSELPAVTKREEDAEREREAARRKCVHRPRAEKYIPIGRASYENVASA